MKFEAFKAVIVRILKDYYKDSAEVVEHKVYKNG